MRNDLKEKAIRLSRYLHIAAEHQEMTNSFELFRSRMEGLQAATITDMPTAHSQSDKMAANIAKLEQLEAKYADKTAQLMAELNLIESIISCLESPAQRRMLRMKYIDGIKWERIAVNMSYSWQHVHRIHAEALRLIRFV
jgi:hypothetical protein